VSPEDESEGDTSGQGLIGQQAGEPETVLVEVPAGADAALYLVETQGLDEGNYWVSLKETVEDGEVLTHIEVGWESDEEVQGLSRDGKVGAVQFLLPNEEITEEIAEQVRELLEGSDTGTEGSGLWGMSSGQELDWDRAEVVLLGKPAEGEEVEALLVIPEVGDGTEGQQLWGRTRPAIDPRQAIYAKVKVKKKAVTQGGYTTSFEVTMPSSQVRQGSELHFKPFDLCPYQYYGKVSLFRKPLCHYWERKVTRKIQRVTFNRGLRTLPIVQAQTQQVLQSTKGGVIGLMGPKGGLILANIKKDVTPEKLQQIYDHVVKASPVEGQQINAFIEALKQILLRLGLSSTSAGLIVAVVADLMMIMNDMISQADNLGEGLLNAVTGPGDLASIQNRLRDTYTEWREGRVDPGTPEAAVGEFIDRIAQFLVDNGFTSSETAIVDTIDMLANFLYDFAQAGLNTTMQSLIERFGPLAPFIYTQMKEFNSQLIASWIYAYPRDAELCTEAHREDPTIPLIEDPLLCFLWQINRLASSVGSMDLLMGYLAAMAYLANHAAPFKNE